MRDYHNRKKLIYANLPQLEDQVQSARTQLNRMLLYEDALEAPGKPVRDETSDDLTGTERASRLKTTRNRYKAALHGWLTAELARMTVILKEMEGTLDFHT